jgi:hypothetical protein
LRLRGFAWNLFFYRALAAMARLAYARYAGIPNISPAANNVRIESFTASA